MIPTPPPLEEITAQFIRELERLRSTVETVQQGMRSAAMQIAASHEIIASMMIVNEAGQKFDAVLKREANGYLQGKVIQVLTRERRYKVEAIQGYYTGPVTVQDIEERFYHEHFGGRDAKLLDGNRFSVIRHLD